jgi:hypothetical protein
MTRDEFEAARQRLGILLNKKSGRILSYDKLEKAIGVSKSAQINYMKHVGEVGYQPVPRLLEWALKAYEDSIPQEQEHGAASAAPTEATPADSDSVPKATVIEFLEMIKKNSNDPSAIRFHAQLRLDRLNPTPGE